MGECSRTGVGFDMDESPILGQYIAKLDLAFSAAIADGFGIHAQELIRRGSNVFQRVFVLLVAIFRAIEEMSVGNRHIVVVAVDLGNEVLVNAEPFSAIDTICLSTPPVVYMLQKVCEHPGRWREAARPGCEVY